MPPSLVDRSARLLERRLDRRGFLVRSALAGSALAAAPAAYILRPVDAYAAICSCSGSSCDCGSLCCDGYTEFCCTLTGANRCPPGSITAGWWKADGSGFCDLNGDPRPRYYLDCNSACGSCACGSSGVCSGTCSSTPCGCGRGSCGNRKAGCTHFRYGQCNQQVACVGPIVCRVVTCTPPWQLDPSCTKAVLTDNSTRFHDRPCLHPRPSGIAVRRGVEWELRDTASAGDPDRSFTYGLPTDIPVFGDWDGDGVKTPGVVRGNQWLLRNSNSSGPAHLSFTFGIEGDVPVVGDWTGQGRDLPGVVRDGRTWYLRHSLSSGPANQSFAYGAPGDVPVVGDWDGNGRDSVGVVRDGRQWFLRNGTSGGTAQITLTYGTEGDLPIVGDWNGDGRDSVGVVRGTTWLLRDRLSSGPANLSFEYGQAGDQPLVWRL